MAKREGKEIIDGRKKKGEGQWEKGEFKLPSEKHRAGLSSTICTYGKGF